MSLRSIVASVVGKNGRVATAIAVRLNIEAATNPELSELAQDVRPEQVLAQMDKLHNSTRHF